MPIAVNEDPVTVLRDWVALASGKLGDEGNAMVLATATPVGVPSARVVLCRAIGDDGGVTFYTNYESRKGGELAANPHASAVFFWWSLDRQARIEGRVEKLPDAASDAYWAGRPRGSQLSGWASPQSSTIREKAELETRRAEAEAQFEGQPVPRPANWGGLVLRPRAIEFWTRGAERLHDRVRFERDGDRWASSILAP